MKGGFPEGLSCIEFSRNIDTYMCVCIYMYTDTYTKHRTTKLVICSFTPPSCFL